MFLFIFILPVVVAIVTAVLIDLINKKKGNSPAYTNSERKNYHRAKFMSQSPPTSLI